MPIVYHDRDHCDKAQSCSCWHAVCCAPYKDREPRHCKAPEDGCHMGCVDG